MSYITVQNEIYNCFLGCLLHVQCFVILLSISRGCLYLEKLRKNVTCGFCFPAYDSQSTCRELDHTAKHPAPKETKNPSELQQN